MPTLMIQGTTSDAGKSTLVTALCRWLARRGVSVAPFKPQNMALNGAITVDGGEIGRAQAVQAAEINLREGDIANMGFAEAVDCPVILIADIDRGGVFAHLVGTLELLSPSEQARVVGFVINRFRGDLALLQPGLDWLEQRTGKPVLGVLPYLQDLHLEAEDGIDLRQVAGADKQLKVLVLRLPRISNHTDFDPLRWHPQVDLQFAAPGQPLPAADLIIVPGTKNVRADVQFLRSQQWDQQLRRHLRYGGKILGIGGGFQMLGDAIHDPQGLEGAPGSEAGLALLEHQTLMQNAAQPTRHHGVLCLGGARIQGYVMPAGLISGQSLQRPLIELDDGQSEGAISADGQIAGTRWHGAFESPQAATALLEWAGLSHGESIDLAALRERDMERLADLVEQHLDIDVLLQHCGLTH